MLARRWPAAASGRLRDGPERRRGDPAVRRRGAAAGWFCRSRSVARVAPLPADLAKVAAETPRSIAACWWPAGSSRPASRSSPVRPRRPMTKQPRLKRFLDAHPFASVLVVTDGYHTRRSRWAFRHVLGEQASQVALVSAPTDEFDINCWWRDQWGLAAVGAEYLKLAAYVVYYGHFLPWLAACLSARRRRSLCENACRLCFSITPCTAMPCVMLKHNLQTPLLALRTSVPHLEPERRRRESSDLGPHRGWPVPPHSRA